MFEVERYHDFSAGHRVYGHEGKCAQLHGHEYRVHFVCTAVDLDSVGRVIDFSEINRRLCKWLEENWDHRFLIWENDPIARDLHGIDNSVVVVEFNPTAENIAQHLVSTVGPKQLKGTGIVLVRCRVEETRKCSATYVLEFIDDELANDNDDGWEI